MLNMQRLSSPVSRIQSLRAHRPGAMQLGGTTAADATCTDATTKAESSIVATLELAESTNVQDLLVGSGPGMQPCGPTLDRVCPRPFCEPGAGLQRRHHAAKPAAGFREVHAPDRGGHSAEKVVMKSE